MKHPYLKMPESQRHVFLASQSDDDLKVLEKDLLYLGVSCPILVGLLVRREIDQAVLDSHVLPSAFFYPPARNRRLPNKIEYVWKRGLFLALKFSFLPLLLWGPIMVFVHEGVGFGVALIGAVCLFIPVIFAWFNCFYCPLRYTLVRPFNDSAFSKPLKRFIIHNIGLRCQGIGLSDRHLRPNTVLGVYHRFQWLIVLVAVPLGVSIGGVALIVAVISTWVRQSIRILDLKMPSAFLFIQPALVRRHRLAAQHFACGGQCFNIRCIHEAWQYAIQVLVHESDFILVDLTCVRPASDWEIEYLKRQDRLANCIPICQIGSSAYLDYVDIFSQNVIYYDKSGRVSEGDDIVQRIELAASQRAGADKNVQVPVGQQVPILRNIEYRETEFTKFRRFTLLRLIGSVIGGVCIAGIFVGLAEAITRRTIEGSTAVGYFTLSCQIAVYCLFTWRSYKRAGRPIR